MSIQEFNSLVLVNAEGLKPFAITLTKDHEVAQDLYQDTLYKAFINRDKYMTGTNIKAWLSTIMRNIFINDYRRQERKRNVLDVVAYKAKNESDFVSSDHLLVMKEIKKAIHNLPETFRKACILYLEGYKYSEIAIALNEPLGTIKSRIHFAKKILQNQIER